MATQRKIPTDPDPTRFWQKIGLVADIAAYCRGKAPTPSTFVEVLKMIKTILPFDGATLYLKNDRADRYDEVASLGERVEPISFLRIGQGKGLTGWAAASKKPVLLADRPESTDFEGDVLFRSFMSLPLLIDGDVLGVVNLGCRRPKAFEQKDVRLMTVVADQLAISIERQLFQQEIERKNNALAEAHNQLLLAHSQKVAAEKLRVVLKMAAVINHQINNPLAVIVGNIQCLFAEGEVPNQKVLSRLRRIEAAALHVGAINRKLLEIDHLTAEDFLDTASDWYRHPGAEVEWLTPVYPSMED
ncbi:MAG: GAF domain-containing protein [candidate division Zixibacteria bacterium]|nr:GAF domain-containing protein [candidate division Zixibacteria bacterium]